MFLLEGLEDPVNQIFVPHSQQKSKEKKEFQLLLVDTITAAGSQHEPPPCGGALIVGIKLVKLIHI